MIHLRASSGSTKSKARRCCWRRARSEQLFELRPLEVRCGKLAALAHYVVGELLALDQARHSGTLDRGNMHEHIVAAVDRLDEAETLGRIEELYGTCGHIWLL